MVCEYHPELMVHEVLYEQGAGVARVTINRPERRNAMSFEVMQGLRDAFAGGFGRACACGVIVASDDSVCGAPEINVGVWPYMIPVRLLRSMPAKTALDLMMTGRRVSADEGARIGFVQRVVPVAELDATVDALAAELASKSPIIMRWGRDAFYRVLEMDADAALSYLQGMLTVTSQTEDTAEGIAAFAEKRAPEWKGR